MTTIPSSFPTIITTARVVPNLQPLLPPLSQRIALIGEAPGEDEEQYGIPFVGRSGKFLDTILQGVGIERTRCFVGNVCQVRPPGNDISRFGWDHENIVSGLAKLRTDLEQFRPNICVLLGGTPLRAAGIEGKITDWRASLFVSSKLTGSPIKCMGCYHPAYTLREFSPGYVLTKFDLQRAKDESTTPILVLPKRELITSWPASDLCHVMDQWPAGQRCSLDIEGGLSGWPCVSICATPTKSITIAWGRLSEDDHLHVLRSFARLMARCDVPKVLQNSLYDNFVLSYGFGIPIRNVVEDTMLKGWEVYCELPKGLGTQCSIWTREPFYKVERKSDDAEVFFQYCGKDSAVTLEICLAQDSALDATSYRHYRANVDMLNPLLYMEMRGIKYDREKVTKRLEEVKTTGWWTEVKEGQEPEWNDSIAEVGKKLNLTAKVELRGAKGSLSSKRLAKTLYTDLGYPPQFKKEGGRKTEKLTTDIEAILNLRKKLPSDTFLSQILAHRHLEGLLETLQIKPDPDGRVRCGYNVVGTETGRLTCYTSPTGAGANLQTITKSLRSNYVADPEYDFFQCDLEGADGWTVAAHCARLGDGTMLEDYYAGIKPAKVIGLLYYFGAQINQLERHVLKWACDVIFPIILRDVGKWLYLGCKRVQHGSNYLMGIPTMLLNIMKDSYKESGEPVYMEHATARVLQELYFSRYPGVRLWHRWAEAQLVATGTLTSASGQTRTFFGRRFGKDIHDTVKEFLAHEPQSNTTWSTNLAMLALWSDPENRRSNGSLIIEPLHQVHDALCGQWPVACRDWARAKVRTYFNNPLTIAGTTLTIPFDGGWGPSWGECGDKNADGTFKLNCGSL